MASWISRVRLEVSTTIGGSVAFTVPISGIVNLEVRQYFQKIRLERLVGAVQFVDQQYRRRALTAFEGLHQRALDEKALGEDVLRDPCRATPLESRPA